MKCLNYGPCYQPYVKINAKKNKHPEMAVQSAERNGA